LIPTAEKVKTVLGFRGKGRKISSSGEGYQVRETPAGYNAFLRVEKEDIGPETPIPGGLIFRYQ